MIPKTIHQTWKTEDVPHYLQKLAEKWKKLHADWKYILWTDEMNRGFIKKEYPRFLPIYDAYPYNIQRVDAVRYFILYTCGGVYIDLDFVPLKNIEPLLKNKQCVFGLESEINCRRISAKRIISNAFMGSIQRHPFFESIIHDLQTYKAKEKPGSDLVLETTGPFALNRVYETYPDKDRVTLLHSAHLYPIDYLEASFWPSPHLTKKTRDAYAVHLFEGRWWKEIGIRSPIIQKPE
jgi:mannosyltransferase OCH1-like enzyme